MEFKLKVLRQRGNKVLIGVGFRTANLMMKVRYREHDPEFQAQFQQEAQQGRGICAAGNCDGNALSWLEQALLANIFEHFVPHVGLVSL
jgi:hypothetical protein